MAPRPLDAEQLIPRYLAGQLTPAECEEFERAVTESVDLREQTELVLKLKEGLARLRERGELTVLLREPARPPWLPYATAAAVVILLLAGLAWLYRPGALPNVLGLSPQQFVSDRHVSPTLVGSYVLARLRGRVPVTELDRTGVIELRVVPSVLSPGIRYRAELRAIDHAARGRALGQLDTGPTAADGYVTFYLDSRRLAPGDYEVSLSPLGIAALPADRFPIRVR